MPSISPQSPNADIVAQMRPALVKYFRRKCGSAEEAEDLAAKHRPKLVVMDIHLAGERDGVDAALTIFRTHGIRSVFATAHQDSHTRHRAEPSAPLGWLSKPYAIDHLTATVRNALAAIDNPG